jgi:hypothetical protein
MIKIGHRLQPIGRRAAGDGARSSALSADLGNSDIDIDVRVSKICVIPPAR